MSIAVIDLGISNIASVVRAFDMVGEPVITATAGSDISTASAIILPGVGAFPEGMASLRARGLDRPLLSAARYQVPIFGICLGMQLLAKSSEEHGLHEGLGLLNGHVRKLPDTSNDRVPNMGWCDVEPVRPCVLFSEYSPNCYYHVHSFHLVPEDRTSVVATTRFAGVDIVVAVEQGNIFGVQFHPEKSQDDGLRLIAAFAAHARQTARVPH